MRPKATEVPVGTSVDVSWSPRGFYTLDGISVSPLTRAVVISKVGRNVGVECLEPGPVTITMMSDSCSGTRTAEITCTPADDPELDPHPDLGEGGATGEVRRCTRGREAIDGGCTASAVLARLAELANAGAGGSGGATGIAGGGGTTGIAGGGGATSGQSCDATGTWHVWFPDVESCDAGSCTGGDQPPFAHVELTAPTQLEVSGDGCELAYESARAWTNSSECGAYGYRLTLTVDGDEAIGLLHQVETGFCAKELFIGAVARRLP